MNVRLGRNSFAVGLFQIELANFFVDGIVMVWDTDNDLRNIGNPNRLGDLSLLVRECGNSSSAFPPIV